MTPSPNPRLEHMLHIISGIILPDMKVSYLIPACRDLIHIKEAQGSASLRVTWEHK